MIPERIFIRVDLPAPFSPTIAWISPAQKIDLDALENCYRSKGLGNIPGRQYRARFGFVWHLRSAFPKGEDTVDRGHGMRYDA